MDIPPPPRSIHFFCFPHVLGRRVAAGPAAARAGEINSERKISRSHIITCTRAPAATVSYVIKPRDNTTTLCTRAPTKTTNFTIIIRISTVCALRRVRSVLRGARSKKSVWPMVNYGEVYRPPLPSQWVEKVRTGYIRIYTYIHTYTYTSIYIYNTGVGIIYREKYRRK